MEMPRRSGAGCPAEAALSDASENSSDTENDEGPEQGAPAKYENGRPATRPLLPRSGQLPLVKLGSSVIEQWVSRGTIHAKLLLSIGKREQPIVKEILSRIVY